MDSHSWNVGGPSGYRWPKVGDQLLRPEEEWDKSTSFSEDTMARDVHLWDGYMRAGALLIETCERDGDRLDRHELVYPILFCYRHGLELAMKWIINQYGRFAGIQQAKPKHGLEDLWEDCKQVLLEVGADGEEEALSAVENIVHEFHKWDEGSFSFRYATNKEGLLIQLPEAPFVLANVKEVMEGVAHFFDGAAGQLDANVKAVDW